MVFLNNFIPITHDWIPFYFMLGKGKYLGLKNIKTTYILRYSQIKEKIEIA